MIIRCDRPHSVTKTTPRLETVRPMGRSKSTLMSARSSFDESEFLSSTIAESSPVGVNN